MTERVDESRRAVLRAVAQSGPDPDKRVLRLAFTAVALLSVGLLAMVVRVATLQSQPPELVARRIGGQVSGGALMARRGALLDRRGRPLAVTRVAETLFVDPRLIVDRNTFSEHVAYNLELDPVWVEKTVARRPHSRFIVLERRMDERRADVAVELDVPGLATQPILVRDYPFGATAGQLLGFVGNDAEGLEGLELALNEKLTPRPGGYRILRDARRQPLWIEADSYTPQDDGPAVRLSVDVAIQAIVERCLAETIEKYNASAGQMIVMDPRTGEILAMANHPPFTPAEFADLPAELRRNRAVTDVFEPGSIFKPFVWSALTQMGAMRPHDTLDCTTAGVWVTDYGRRLRDAHGHGTLTWDEVLVKSSNIGMAKGAENISIEQLHDVVRAFGFGATTGSGLPGESPGLVNPLPQWNKYSQTSIPMGQEIGATALQMVRAFAVLANGGLLITPSIEADPPVHADDVQRVLTPAVAAYTRGVLRRVVTEGTGRRANSKLYALFGKTGTAQLPDFVNGGYHQDRYVSSFLGGGPYEDPRLVVGCFIQDPDRSKGHYGGIVAAPAVMKAIEQSLLYLGVPPNANPDGEQNDHDQPPSRLVQRN